MNVFDPTTLAREITDELNVDPIHISRKNMIKQNTKLAKGMLNGMQFKEVTPSTDQMLVWNNATQLWTPSMCISGDVPSPPTGEDITVFTTTYNFYDSTVKVYKNGSRISNSDYTLSGSNTITFAIEPSGSLIVDYIQKI